MFSQLPLFGLQTNRICPICRADSCIPAETSSDSVSAVAAAVANELIEDIEEDDVNDEEDIEDIIEVQDSVVIISDD